MTRHRCTDSVDSCAVCSSRRDAYEAGPLASDVDAAIARAEDQFERFIYGEDRWY